MADDYIPNLVPLPLTWRRGAFEFTDSWKRAVSSLPETGMGYIVVRVALHDGRVFPQVLISDMGVVDRVRGLPDIPFRQDDVIEITATHEKWDWNERP